MSTRSRVGCGVFGEGDASGRDGNAGIGHAGCVAGGVIAAPFELIDDLDLNGSFRDRR